MLMVLGIRNCSCDLSLVGLSNATTRWDNVTFQRVGEWTASISPHSRSFSSSSRADSVKLPSTIISLQIYLVLSHTIQSALVSSNAELYHSPLFLDVPVPEDAFGWNSSHLIHLCNATSITHCDISNPQDVIHISLVSLQIRNYRQLLERCARMLRKGGLMVITEVEVFFVSLAVRLR